MDEQDRMPFFMEIHSDNPREGPGSLESTTRAFRLLAELPPQPNILDVGCGPGKQTLDLAGLTGGHITAVDNGPSYIDVLKQRIAERHFETRVRAMIGDMTALDFAPERFDLIWSEGAIYIMGFEQGLRQWGKLLKPGGYIAVSELTWLVENPPEAVRAFWSEGYPAMRTVNDNLAVIKACGYQPTGHFTLPASNWWQDYYNPIAAKLPAFRTKHHGNPAAQAAADMEQAEMALYRKHADVYGYVFYTMRRADRHL